ncbi:hypothetical protein Rhe02_64740 [Rhizocola hellebori]|uniref:DinB-like domain-containing protein n=1 Tax=Rhizocola hellebori TaxID=1392758 RepID=A0A8J3QF22_9ACTN|nr:DinB family protein [Rhizocola hellebori]GIH08407.1 hypothetical protein Rhe02_64740 [Rhizocola hellebori]
MEISWGRLLVDQLEFYWEFHLRPRLAGLTDEEYFWEPVEGCWSVRPGSDGLFLMDGRVPGAPPPTLTTIAWRMMHLAVECLATRTSAFFSDSDLPDEVSMWDIRREPAQLPGTADDAVAFLEKHYLAWHAGISALDEAGLSAPLGPRGARFAQDPMAGLIVHISREFIHHGAEIALMRDFYRAR